ncbi:MAG TPA: hypothetical protein VGN83_22130 [Falsiroseomonas sp.]|jgi:hypothetical protein|nr:hypothetical protein [Falsiroseomonas sp.]
MDDEVKVLLRDIRASQVELIDAVAANTAGLKQLADAMKGDGLSDFAEEFDPVHGSAQSPA